MHLALAESAGCERFFSLDGNHLKVQNLGSMAVSKPYGPPQAQFRARGMTSPEITTDADGVNWARSPKGVNVALIEEPTQWADDVVGQLTLIPMTNDLVRSTAAFRSDLPLHQFRRFCEWVDLAVTQAQATGDPHENGFSSSRNVPGGWYMVCVEREMPDLS